jgi:hypothetical protein
MKTKIFAIFVTLLLALVFAGYAYGNWFSTININGNTTTGTLELSAWDFSVYNQTGYATITPVFPPSPPYNTLTLNITNTYPGWYAFVDVKFKNTGTIPLEFYSFGLTYNSGQADLLNYYKLGFLYGTPPSLTFNYGPAHLTWYQTTHYYATEFGGMGYPTGFTMIPGDIHDNYLYIGLDSSLSTYQNTSLSVTFWVTATQYVP